VLILFKDLRLQKNIPYCRDHMRRLSKAGLFPKPVALSNRRIAFIESEIDAWIAAKIAARDGQVPPVPPLSRGMPEDVHRGPGKRPIATE